MSVANILSRFILSYENVLYNRVASNQSLTFICTKCVKFCAFIMTESESIIFKNIWSGLLL